MHSITAGKSELNEARLINTRTPYPHVTVLNLYIDYVSYVCKTTAESILHIYYVIMGLLDTSLKMLFHDSFQQLDHASTIRRSVLSSCCCCLARRSCICCICCCCASNSLKMPLLSVVETRRVLPTFCEVTFRISFHNQDKILPLSRNSKKDILDSSNFRPSFVVTRSKTLVTQFSPASSCNPNIRTLFFLLYCSFAIECSLTS